MENPVKFGDEGKTVEIGESVFARRKYNRGRKCKKNSGYSVAFVAKQKSVFYTQWIIEKKETLLHVIGEAILPGTTVISDQWASYDSFSSIPDKKYIHLSVNHSRNFKDPATGACTNRIESIWNVAKSKNKKRWGTH